MFCPLDTLQEMQSVFSENLLLSTKLLTGGGWLAYNCRGESRRADPNIAWEYQCCKYAVVFEECILWDGVNDGGQSVTKETG